MSTAACLRDMPKVTWKVNAVDDERIGFNRVVAKDVIGEVDNSAYPAIHVNIHMTVVTPANAAAPVPVLIMFGHAGFPAPKEPTDEEFERINAAWKGATRAAGPFLEGCLRDSIRHGSRQRRRPFSCRR